MGMIQTFADENFTLGPYQILKYDRQRRDIFPDGYLSKLYRLCREATRRPSPSSLGILPNLFCGMLDLSHDAITCYLAQRTVILLLTIKTGPDPVDFIETGFIFPSVFNGKAPDRNVFLGYGIFKEFWGSDDIILLGLLGISYFFHAFSLQAAHGIRYADNELTAHFTQNFGFRDVGKIPKYMAGRDGKLADATISSLLIEDFERSCEEYFLADPIGDLNQNGRKDILTRARRRSRRTAGLRE